MNPLRRVLFFVESETMTGEVDNVVQEAADSNAAFEASFNGEAAPAPSISEEPVKQEGKVETKVEAKQEQVDPWKDVPPAIRQSFEALDHRFKSFEGRIGGFQKALDEARAKTPAADAPTKREIQRAIKNPESWERMKVEFPDFFTAVEERINAEREAAPSAASPFDADGFKKQNSTSISQQLSEATATAREQARVYARIDIAHDGWESTLKTPAFKTWFTTQAPDIQALGASDKAADVIRVLDAFTEHQKSAAASAEEAAAKKEREEANQKRLNAAITPTGKPRTGTGTTSAEDAFEAAFNS
jgi:hypothetical protein